MELDDFSELMFDLEIDPTDPGLKSGKDEEPSFGLDLDPCLSSTGVEVPDQWYASGDCKLPVPDAFSIEVPRDFNEMEYLLSLLRKGESDASDQECDSVFGSGEDTQTDDEVGSALSSS